MKIAKKKIVSLFGILAALGLVSLFSFLGVRIGQKVRSISKTTQQETEAITNVTVKEVASVPAGITSDCQVKQGSDSNDYRYAGCNGAY